MIVVGIDPGVAGAIAFTDDRWPGTVDVFDMPTIEVRGKRRVSPIGLVNLLTEIGRVDLVVVEDVHALQGSAAGATFAFGRGVGVIEGVLAALARPTQYVNPRVWTKALGVGADKGAHRQAAQRLFPGSADLFARVRDDGRADAALIAYWATQAREVAA